MPRLASCVAGPLPHYPLCAYVLRFLVCESCSAVKLWRLLVWAGMPALIAFDPKDVTSAMMMTIYFSL